MTLSDLGLLLKAIVSAIPKAMVDYKANKPLRPAQAITGAQAAAGARKFQTLLAQAAPLLEAHPGAITAADDILDALDGAGFAWWAADTKEAVDATPAAVSALRQVLPEIIWAMSAFQPAATGIQGDGRSSMWLS